MEKCLRVCGFFEGLYVEDTLLLEVSALVNLQVQESDRVLVVGHCELDSVHEGVEVCQKSF